MKRLLIFAGLVALITIALVWTEKARVAAPASPSAVLHFVGDTERELTRLPVAFVAMPDDEEIKIGDDLARRYGAALRGSGKRPNSSAKIVEGYVREVGGRVAANAHRKLPYRFHYIDDPSFLNAFALPGGHVFIGEGLISLMDSEDELAAVLGHEIEHIDHYHAAERVETQEALQRIPLGGLVGIPVEVFEAGYSKEEELEADREGTRLAVAAGYSPLGALRMFQTFDRLYQEYVVKAQSPQAELANVTVQTLAGYFRSHPLPSERIAQVQQMISAEHWTGLTSERPLGVAYMFWTERAQRAEREFQYDYAARTAAYSLKLQPDQPDALDALGRAQFMLADFDAAAATDRQLLEKRPEDADAAGQYASALSARGNPSAAAREFQEWLSHAKFSDPDAAMQTAVDEAGLWLLAGNPKPAAQIEEQLKTNAIVAAPVDLGRLGAWNYRAGRYDHAADLLQSALEQRPQETTLRAELGWTLIEQHKYDSAVEQFNRCETRTGAGGRVSPLSGPLMGAAVAFWESRQPDTALAEFEAAVREESFWLNDRWVKALFAPDVATSIAAMRAERERRRKQQQSKLSRTGPSDSE